jgi:hypothetical protein
MFDSFRRRVGLSYSQQHFRNTRDRIMNFTDALSRSHRALVIFPELSPDRESIATLFRYLLKKFPSEKMTVLIRDDQLFAMASAPPLKTLTYSQRDINTWFVPRRELVKKMELNTYDVALDLNVGLSLPSAFLCKASNAPLRVSFAKKSGDHFYNFQVQTKNETGNSITYTNLLKCLDMF